MKYPRVASLKSIDQLRQHLAEIETDLPITTEKVFGADSALGQEFQLGQQIIGNRFAILPMEGWDGTDDGKPSDLTRRRWKNFGESGAKLIWGCEAVAVRPDGRANPNQLLINEPNLSELCALREMMVAAHRARFGNTEDLFVGLQLTHSGRYARPFRQDRPEAQAIYLHPWLDRQQSNSRPTPTILSDAQIDELVAQFVSAAALADRAGFAFVDIKHCHGYLGHELLSAYDRPGRYGGSLANRARFLQEIISGIRATSPQLAIGVRLSAFDFGPFEKLDSGVGELAIQRPYRHAFGGDDSGSGIDLAEPIELLEMLRDLGVRLICTTAGCPYYNAHIQRPAYQPPADGYWPPEDPLVGVARQIAVTKELKSRFPSLVFVGSGYSYLQEWLPHVAAAVVQQGFADFVGLGRMVLSYPKLPSDVLAGNDLDRQRICRTFSDCTTAPRHGMISGCFPLDPFYKKMAIRQQLVKLRARIR